MQPQSAPGVTQPDLAAAVVRRPRTAAPPLAVLTAAAVWVSIRGIDHRFISFSDGAYMYAASVAAAHGLHQLYTTVALSLPPGAVVGAAMMWRASPHIEAIRFALALGSAATALLTYRVARECFELSSGTAVVAAVVALTAPIHAQFVGLEGEAVLTPLALLLVLTLHQDRRVQSLLVMSIGFLFKLTWAPFFVAGVIALAQRFGRRTAACVGAAALALAAACYTSLSVGYGWSAQTLTNELVFAERNSGLQLHLVPMLLVMTALFWWPFLALVPSGWRRGTLEANYVIAAGAASALFMLKQGTFFNVVDPLEPFLAVLAVGGAARVWRRQRAAGLGLLALCSAGAALHIASVTTGSAERMLPLPIGAGVINVDNADTVDRVAQAVDANSAPTQPVVVNPLIALVAHRTEALDAADWFILHSCAGTCGDWAALKRAARQGRIPVISVDSNVAAFDPSFRRDIGLNGFVRALRIDDPPIETAIYVRPSSASRRSGR